MNYSKWVQIVSLISIISSASVILTLCFKGMRHKLFMQIITIISLCDLIANTPYTSVRRYRNDSAGCLIEGFINIYFYPVSWLWTTALMALLYSLATVGKLPLSYPLVSAICWIIPLILTMLNFATVNSKNAADKGRYSFEICSLGNAGFTSEIYHLITYYGLLILCFLVMLSMYIKILYAENQFPMFEAAKNTLILYPLALFACWTPHIVAIILVDYVDVPGESTFYLVADCIKIFHGTVTAVIFFYKSSEARSRWGRLFFKLYNHLRVTVGLPPLASEVPSAVVTDFSVEYEDQSERGSVVEARPFPSDDKQGDISAVHLWGGFFGGSNSRTNSRSTSRSSYGNNNLINTTQSKLHSSKDGGEMRDSIVEMS